MKILFLDIDGVLCTRRSHISYGKEGGLWSMWDPLACHAVKRSCINGVKIVISSTWRKPMHQRLLIKRLQEHGFLHSYLHQDWKTKCLKSGHRGEEIEEWLDRHAGEFESYVILDDDSDMLEHQMLRLIHTDMENGMDSNNIKRLLNWAGVLKS